MGAKKFIGQMPQVDHQSIVDWLRNPRNYPEQTSNVQLIETHISQVFLTDHFVYKLKKPVRYDFLDFSTLAMRELACREELRLNRRMTHDVYLDVWPITLENSGTLQLNGSGRTVDWLVRMRRLPAERMLDELIRGKSLIANDVRHLIDYLAHYYANAESLSMNPEEYHAALVVHVVGNLQGMLAATGIDVAQVRRVLSPQLRLLRCQASLFYKRAQEGRVIDGHGDLRPEHICLADPPAVFDCLEFNEDLRRVDVLDELCFLAMECDLLQAKELGDRLLEVYRQQSHDRPPRELILFYKSYRATVRAKVAALRVEQLEAQPREAQRQLAKKYLDLADGYLREAGVRPLLICVAGLMGTGKSTLARALAAELGTEVLRTDELRHELFPVSQKQESFGAGRYQAESRARVYDELLRRTHARLQAGVSIILDATFAQAEPREAALVCGRDSGADVFLVECLCPREIALQRIESRRQQVIPDPSEARPDLYDRQAAEWQQISNEIPHTQVDTTLTRSDQLAKVFAKLPVPLPGIQ